MPGTRAFYNGTNWEAVEQETGRRQGWTWRSISGKPAYSYNLDNDLRFFEYPDSEYEDSIYNQKMSNSDVTTGRQPSKQRSSRGSRVISIPSEITSPETALAYIKNHPEAKEAAEIYLAKDARVAYLYARDILKREFIMGEPAIAKDPIYATKYAISVLGRPWAQAEPAIRSNDQAWLNYKAKFPQVGSKP